MSFAFPLAFLLVFPLAIATWRIFRRGTKRGIVFSATARLPERTAGWRVAVARAMPLVFLAGMFLLIIAAARPRSPLAQETRSVNAIAINMVVDVSGSMEALDLTPKGESWQSRLDVVKKLFTQFIEARPDDLVGLVTFGGYAATRAPLTADHRALCHVLSGVEVPRTQYDANGQPVDQDELLTAVGDGLATGVARLVDAEPKTKIIVLLSDGESNTGITTPDQAADAAAKLGIRVYAIGVGSNGPAPFRTRDMFGREVIGHANITFDEEQLKSIAEKTNGTYFRVRDNEGLKAALEQINTLEKTRIEREVYQRWNEHFVGFLLWGALLAALAVTVNMHVIRRMI